MNTPFTGTGTAIITPFTKNMDIDYPALDQLIEFQISNNIDYIVFLGTTGESVTLSKEEKQQLIRFATEKVRKRVPIVIGIGGNNTAEVINLIKNTDFKNIDAILSVCPYYNKPQQDGIFAHYKAISEVSPIPIIIYNVPGRTGANIKWETTIKIAKELKNVIAVKEASGIMEQIMKIIQHKPANFKVISGDDALTLPMLAAGAEGVISVVSNAYPKEFSQMVRYCIYGEFNKAKEIHYKLLDFIDALFADGSPAGIKAALEIMGFIQSYVRLPLANVNASVYETIKKILTK